MPTSVYVLALLGSAAGLNLSPLATSEGSRLRSSSRREAVHSAAKLALLGLAAPLAPALAYDTIPTADPDFEKIQKLRQEREAADKLEVKKINGFIKEIENAPSAEAFIAACDKFSLYVIAQGKFPDGSNVKGLVTRIRESYELLPKRAFACEKTRTNDGVCFSPGKDVESAYESLLREMRKYSLIVVGDYRTVTFKAF
eukprot:CAMPEP_0206154076 /NCGR_PEP_ID=MMETSP1474-20131121/1091_1 /ASSEMBLY_ACC=CAM_ASM_001110 /TAXON_ID=97495 /ORGANISM="Imantonia sp., Strain RCC918" /LENGTH=198 /DNA_ID=CAMNT_0053552119 /DNA_START=35 /DNA_END=631 /DNA_ORIENTATION=-